MLRKTLVFGLATTLATTLAVAGCRSSQSSIPVTANDFDLGPLVGRWAGEYSSEDTGRSGTIRFTLGAGESAASGNVVMIPRAQADASAPTGDQPVAIGGTTGIAREVLTIHFVRKESSKVLGTLDSYIDPECKCKVTTTFDGVFADDRTIAGTFSTAHADGTGRITVGKWRVTRTRRQ